MGGGGGEDERLELRAASARKSQRFFVPQNDSGDNAPPCGE